MLVPFQALFDLFIVFQVCERTVHHFSGGSVSITRNKQPALSVPPQALLTASGRKKRFLERVKDPNTSAGWLTVMGGAWGDVTGWEKYKRVPARHLQTPSAAGRAGESASQHLHPSAASHVLQHQRASSHHSLGLRAGR